MVMDASQPESINLQFHRLVNFLWLFMQTKEQWLQETPEVGSSSVAWNILLRSDLSTARDPHWEAAGFLIRRLKRQWHQWEMWSEVR